MSDTLRDEYVASLEAENDELRARLRDMERLAGHRNVVPLIFRLTSSEAKVMSMLIGRDQATKDQILDALMVGRGADDEPEPKIVDVYVCKMRSKLKKFGVEIETIWGRGYRITAENKARIAAYLDPSTTIIQPALELSSG